MPSPLAPDPIRVQSCVWCLYYWSETINPCIGAIAVNGNIYYYWSETINPCISAIAVNGNIYYYWSETIMKNTIQKKIK